MSGTTSRRSWLREALLGAALPAALRAAAAGEEDVPFLDEAEFRTEVHPANPRVKCQDWRRLRGPVTPNGDFFVFHQTSAPAIDAARWRLRVGGLVERPGDFNLEDLARLAGPRREYEFTLECAGNLARPEIMHGQVGNARWGGFRLTELLRHCGVQPAAREAVFLGADQVRDSAGVAHGPHGRSVFIQDVLDADALLATHMNGVPLPVEHGYPLRLILPGWYGMAQIKWLTRIEFIDRRYEGPHMSRNYHTLHVLPSAAAEPLVLETSISRLRLKSVVARVTRGRAGGAGWIRVHGAAWGGASPIARVEVRVDDGPWRAAELGPADEPYAWRLWWCDWEPLAPGRHTVVSRAIDARGNVQPDAAARRAAIRSAREDNSQWVRPFAVPS